MGDLRVTVELGATIPIAEYGNIRPRVAIEGIDPSGDVEGQLTLSLRTASTAFVSIDGFLDEKISEMLASQSATGGPSKLEVMNESLSVMKENIRRIADKIKEHDTVLALEGSVKRGRKKEE